VADRKMANRKLAYRRVADKGFGWWGGYSSIEQGRKKGGRV
jgi:hypothetical protein